MKNITLFLTLGLVALASIFLAGCDDDTTSYDFSAVEGSVLAIDQVDVHVTARVSDPMSGSLMDRLYFYAEAGNLFLIVDVSDEGDWSDIEADLVATYIFNENSITLTSGGDSIAVDYSITDPDVVVISYDASILYEWLEADSGINDIFEDGFATFSGDIVVKLVKTDKEFTPLP